MNKKKPHPAIVISVMIIMPLPIVFLGSWLIIDILEIREFGGLILLLFVICSSASALLTEKFFYHRKNNKIESEDKKKEI